MHRFDALPKVLMFNKQIDDVLFLKMKHLNSKKLIQTSQIKKQK